MQKVIELTKIDPIDADEAYKHIQQFIDDVIRTQDKMTTGETKVQVTLTFSEPTELWYGRRRGYETALVHQVKSVFPSGGLCYMAPAMRARGRRVPMYDLVSVTLTAEERNYTREWAAIARSMRKHSINLALADDIEAHLRGETERIEGSGNNWTIRTKPRTTSFKDVTRGQTLEEMWAERRDYSRADSPDPIVYFRRMKMARNPGSGRGRDRSISLQWYDADHEQYPDSWYFSAASEYEGCGNGSYYLMYSPTRALFLEDD